MIDNEWVGEKKRRAMEGHLLAIKKDETQQDAKGGAIGLSPLIHR